MDGYWGNWITQNIRYIRGWLGEKMGRDRNVDGSEPGGEVEAMIILGLKLEVELELCMAKRI